MVAASLMVIVVLLSIQIGAVGQGVGENLGTLKVTKSTVRVTFENRILVRLTIENNGTTPVFEIEVFEYVNPSFAVASEGSIRYRDGEHKVSLPAATTGTVVQFILNLPGPNALRPGEAAVLEYWATAPAGGDFQIPSSLVWYTYRFGASEIRTSIYSNGLLVHVPQEFEKAITRLYPYVISLATFSGTITVLFWAKGRIARKTSAR